MEGVSGAGKTSIAFRLADKLGFKYKPVETRECARIDNREERQRCFLEKVKDVLMAGPGMVLDNGFATVYGYTVAFLGREHELAKKALAGFYAENELCTTVLLLVDYEELPRRLKEKNNNLPLIYHVAAQENMRRDLAFDVVYETTGEEPEEAATEIAEMILGIIAREELGEVKREKGERENDRQ